VNEADFERKIGYAFSNRDLLNESLTHSSLANESTHGARCNERLEFLGDAALNLIISRCLFEKLGESQEGQLTKLRASIVCERSLAECGRGIGIDKVLKLGRGEEFSGGRKRQSLIADAVEALIGAIYLDGGFDVTTSFTIELFKETIERAILGELFHDYKTELQEVLQGKGAVKIAYLVDKEEGPDHKKIFHVSLREGDEVLGRGMGRSKKEAEQNAAKAALEVLGLVF
jgi:ribonuclease-3